MTCKFNYTLAIWVYTLGIPFSGIFKIILSFRTDRLVQTVQIRIRLLLEEQSDQGLHCLPFNLHILGKKRFGSATLVEF